MFWVDGGYFTSSHSVHKLIEADGKDSFEIIRIKTFELGAEAFEYESRFLKKVKAASNKAFLNGHENSIPGYGTPEYKAMIIKLYGVENISQADCIKEKKAKTHLKNYGVDYRWKSPVLKAIDTTNLQIKYNDPTLTNVSQAQEVKDKKAQTHLANFGIDYRWKSPDLRKSDIESLRIKYNDPTLVNVSQSEEVKKKKEESALEKYGVRNVFQSEAIKEQSRRTNLEKYGVEYASQSQESKDKVNSNRKIKASRLEVDIIKRYVSKFGLHLGKGWYQRNTETLKNMIIDLERKYGLLDDAVVELIF
jgi:hypothetical protein